jgi:ribonuclease HI
LAIIIYTDGSCDTAHKIGAWAALIFEGENKISLEGVIEDTTHQRMELVAVTEALKYSEKNYSNQSVILYTDSQYVAELLSRKERLESSQFITKNKKELSNTDLIKNIYDQCTRMDVKFEKVKAHAAADKEANFNIEVDKRSRKLVRTEVRKKEKF